MKILIFSAALVLILLDTVQSRKGPPGEEGGRGGPGGGRGRGPPRGLSSNSCREYETAVHKTMKEMMDNGEAGLKKCESENRNECRETDMMNAVQKTEATPSPECLQKLAKLFKMIDCQQ